MMLKLADDLRLPLHLVTESIGVLAKRRAGKSTMARRLAEQLHRAKQQIVVADPKGDWWGLLFARDGKAPGLPFVVLGGEHGHIPLEVGAGDLVAKMVVTERVSLVLDLSQFRKHEVATFMTSFMETLYRLKAQEQYRTPLMLIVDEADAIAPQRPQRGEERMLGAVEDLVRRGGQRGIGVTMLTQRSAVLNKNVLTQIGILVVLRTIAPQDLAAMDAWIDVHGTVEQRKALMASLPSLPVGTGWVWAPGWPDTDGIFKRVPFLLPETFDSSATPGQQKSVEPKHAADVDLEAFKREMAATIEKAKADDPRELRKQIAAQKRQIDELSKSSIRPNSLAKALVVEKPVVTDAQITRLEKQVAAITAALDRASALFMKPLGPLAESCQQLASAVRLVRQPAPAVNHAQTRAAYAPRRAPDAPKATGYSPKARVVAADGLTPPRQNILNALAFLNGIGVAPADKTQLALIVGVSPASSGYANNLGSLRSSGLIEYPAGGTVALTEAGKAIASTDGVPATTDDLHKTIRLKLPAPKWRILETLIGAYPHAMKKDDIAERLEVSATSSGFANNLGSLRSLGLIGYPQPGTVAALPVLFLDA